MYGISDTHVTIPGSNAAAYNLRISEKHTFSQMAKPIPHDRPMDSIHWNHLKLWIDQVADPKTMKLLHCLLMKMPCFWKLHLGLYHWPKWKRNRFTQLDTESWSLESKWPSYCFSCSFTFSVSPGTNKLRIVAFLGKFRSMQEPLLSDYDIMKMVIWVIGWSLDGPTLRISS